MIAKKDQLFFFPPIMTDLAAKQVHCDGDLVLASFLSSCLITRPGLQLIPLLHKHQPFIPLLHNINFSFRSCAPSTIHSVPVHHQPFTLFLRSINHSYRSCAASTILSVPVHHQPFIPLLCTINHLFRSCALSMIHSFIAHHQPFIPLLRTIDHSLNHAAHAQSNVLRRGPCQSLKTHLFSRFLTLTRPSSMHI